MHKEYINRNVGNKTTPTHAVLQNARADSCTKSGKTCSIILEMLAVTESHPRSEFQKEVVRILRSKKKLLETEEQHKEISRNIYSTPNYVGLFNKEE